jgi:hypothetical protein
MATLATRILTRRDLLEYLAKATLAYPVLNIAMGMSACRFRRDWDRSWHHHADG